MSDISHAGMDKDDDVYDPETVRKCAALVQFGECITFPNGLTIDKRWVGGAQTSTTYTVPPR